MPNPEIDQAALNPDNLENTRERELTGQTQKTYALILEVLKKHGLELTMSEAVVLRNTVRQCMENWYIKHDHSTTPVSEAVHQFLANYFGIDLQNYFMSGYKSGTREEEMFNQLVQFIKEKLRSDREFI